MRRMLHHVSPFFLLRVYKLSFFADHFMRSRLMTTDGECLMSKQNCAFFWKASKTFAHTYRQRNVPFGSAMHLRTSMWDSFTSSNFQLFFGGYVILWCFFPPKMLEGVHNFMNNASKNFFFRLHCTIRILRIMFYATVSSIVYHILLPTNNLCCIWC